MKKPERYVDLYYILTFLTKVTICATFNALMNLQLIKLRPVVLSFLEHLSKIPQNKSTVL